MTDQTHPYPGVDLLVLDLDQTVRGNRAANWRPPNHTGEQFIYPGIAKILALYVEAGVPVRFATNQGGIQAGHSTVEKTEEVLDETMTLLNGEIGEDLFSLEDVKYCPSTDRSHADRKPNGGMLDDWVEEEDIRQGHDNCLYVGDRETDRQAAMNAGYDFMWAWDFCDGVPVRPEKKR